MRISDALRRLEPPDVTPATVPTSVFAHRADSGGAAAAGDVLTKLTVVLLSSVNAVMWWVYTDSRFMGAVWALFAIVFAVWIKRDASRR
jgi:hypothetical protein